MVPNVLIYGIVSKITLNQSSHGYKSSYQLDDKSLIKLLKAQPSVFCYNIKDNLEPNATWLQERLALDDKSLSKLVQTMPPILGMSIQDNIKPKPSWFQERLSLNNKSLIKLLKTLPSVFGYNIEDNLKLEAHLASSGTRAGWQESLLCNPKHSFGVWLWNWNKSWAYDQVLRGKCWDGRGTIHDCPAAKDA
jgi:hypothetical protein